MNVVLDANVLISANQRDTHASVACAAQCAKILLAAQQTHVVIEDTADLALAEYKKYCSFSGQPGPGDRFLQWFIQNRWTATAVKRVDIGSTADEVTDALPRGLQGMDASDHKWVAMYLVGEGDALYNAVDADWSEHADEFLEHGVNVIELCTVA